MRVEARAKINLTLEVFGKRTDGYHALRSVVMPISLADFLEIEEASSLSSDTGYDDDLCLKAARALDPTRGARIHVEKRIPAGGGLGGGSADAAATLIALNELWGLGRSRTELAEIGAQVGSDVPALVTGGAVVMEGRGEKVTPIAGEVKSFDIILVNPNVHSSTREVYAACTPRSPSEGLSPTRAMVEALQAGSLSYVADALVNDLQTPAIGLHPEIADLLASLRASGTLGAMMSGSGSSVFAIVENARTAERIAEVFRARGFFAWAVRARP